MPIKKQKENMQSTYPMFPGSLKEGGWYPNHFDYDPKIYPQDILDILGTTIKQTANWPQNKSREGLKEISSAISPQPTGNLPMDILEGTPSVVVDALSEVAPSFVSPEAMATMGASRMIPVSALSKFSKLKNIASTKSAMSYPEALMLSTAAKNPGMQMMGISPRVIEIAMKLGASKLSSLGKLGQSQSGIGIAAILSALRKLNKSDKTDNP